MLKALLRRCLLEILEASGVQIERTCQAEQGKIKIYRKSYSITKKQNSPTAKHKTRPCSRRDYNLAVFLMFKLVLEKAEEPEIKLPTSAESSKKQESSRKTSTSALLTMPKPLTVWITINCGKFFKRLEYQTTWSASWEICMQFRKQQLELDIEQQTASK